MLNNEQKTLITIYNNLKEHNYQSLTNIFNLLEPKLFTSKLNQNLFLTFKSIHNQKLQPLNPSTNSKINDLLNDFFPNLPVRINDSKRNHQNFLELTNKVLKQQFASLKYQDKDLNFLNDNNFYLDAITNLKITKNNTEIIQELKSIINKPIPNDEYYKIQTSTQIIETLKNNIQEIPTNLLNSQSISTSIESNKDLILGTTLSKDNLEKKRFFFSKNFGILNYLNAFQKKQIITLGGSTGLGKTAFIYNLIYDMLTHHLNIERPLVVDIFSLEMTSEQNTSRFLSLVSQIPISTIYEKYDNEIENQNFEKIMNQTVNKLTNLNINFIYPISPTLNNIINHIRTKFLTNKINLVIIDHLQLVELTHKESERLGIDEVMKKLKQLAIDLDILVIILSQFSRDGIKGKIEPDISSFKGSGGIETNSDLVITLNEFDKWLDYKQTQLKEVNFISSETKNLFENIDLYENCKLIELVVHKNRSGSMKKILYHFNKECVNFKELGQIPYYQKKKKENQDDSERFY